MSETNQNIESQKPSKKRRKWPWITLGIIIFLVLFVRWSLQADWVFSIIKNQAEQIVSETTGADFRIGELKGDLLRGISVRDVSLTTDEPIITLDSLDVSYRLSALFSRTIDVTELRISGLHASLEQLPDSSWNVMQLAGEPAEPDDSETDFTFTIELRSFILENSSIDVYAPYLLPDERISVRDIEAGASVTYSSDMLDARLD
ncbi:MAG: AsmA family protein, partial [Balneolia bacterium]|nr:AsmA family protein [Balneolia bacterium]